MIEPDFLYIIAEVGAAFAGFSTLVAIIGNRGFVTAQVVSMLMLSVLVVLFALLPSLPAFDLADTGTWRVVSGLYAVSWAIYWVNVLHGFRTYRYGVGFAELAWTNRINAFVVHPGSIAMLIGTAIGLFGDAAASVYTAALFVMLAMSGFLFVQLTHTLISRRDVGEAEDVDG